MRARQLPELVVPTAVAVHAVKALMIENMTPKQAYNVVSFDDDGMREVVGYMGWAEDWSDTGYDEVPRYDGLTPLKSNFFPEVVPGEAGCFCTETVKTLCALILTLYFDGDVTEDKLIALRVAARLEGTDADS